MSALLRVPTPDMTPVGAIAVSEGASLTPPPQAPILDVRTAAEDPVTLMILLHRHKETLGRTLKEVEALKGAIRELETSLAKSERERQSLAAALEASRQSEAQLLAQVHALSDACETVTRNAQSRGVDAAERYTRLECQARQRECQLKSSIDRLHAQLAASQQPVSSVRSAPWHAVANSDAHPAHAVREAVLGDAQWELRLLGGTAPPPPAVDALAALLAASRRPEDAATAGALIAGGGAAAVAAANNSSGRSLDEGRWRQVCRRLFDVLSQRRAALGTTHEQGPTEFLVRTRHTIIQEMVHLHGETRRCCALLWTALECAQSLGSAAGSAVPTSSARASTTTASAATAAWNAGGGSATAFGRSNQALLENYLDVLGSALGDMDHAFSRVRTLMLSDVDRAVHSDSLPVLRTDAGDHL